MIKHPGRQGFAGLGRGLSNCRGIAENLEFPPGRTSSGGEKIVCGASMEVANPAQAGFCHESARGYLFLRSKIPVVMSPAATATMRLKIENTKASELAPSAVPVIGSTLEALIM